MSKWVCRSSSIGVFLTWPWPLLVLLSFATTCTGGDSDSWATTLSLCVLLSLLAFPLLAVSARRSPGSVRRLTVPVVTLGPLVLALGHAFETGFGAHALCGAEYNALGYGDNLWYARWYYPSMWALDVVLSVAALWPWLGRADQTRAASSPTPGAV